MFVLTCVACQSLMIFWQSGRQHDHENLDFHLNRHLEFWTWWSILKTDHSE